MDESFGITPPTDTLGCLQDVHWSAGYIGSFASYTIGAEPNETTSYCITHTHTHTQTHTPAGEGNPDYFPRQARDKQTSGELVVETSTLLFSQAT
jgi:hypothetical protein